MTSPKSVLIYKIACGLVLSYPLAGFAANNAPATTPSRQAATADQHAASERDGQHDFDFEIGAWKTRLKRLIHPLTGSSTWVEYEGTTTVRKVWNGRANLVELEADGSAGHIEALSLRLYNPEAHQWSLNFSNSAGGTMGTPSVGKFKDGRGEFIDQELLGSRMILVRFVISDITPTSCHFEQSYSDDGGRTWEVNWIADDSLPSRASATGRLEPTGWFLPDWLLLI